jgi:hypothetical protein
MDEYARRLDFECQGQTVPELNGGRRSMITETSAAFCRKSFGDHESLFAADDTRTVGESAGSVLGGREVQPRGAPATGGEPVAAPAELLTPDLLLQRLATISQGRPVVAQSAVVTGQADRDGVTGPNGGSRTLTHSP